MARFFIRAVLCAGALALTACESFREQPRPPRGTVAAAQTTPQSAWAQRTQRLGALEAWTLNGRAASGGLFGVKGKLRWQQTGEVFLIDVRGPFGIGAARLSGTPNNVLVQSGKQQWRTAQPEVFLRQQMGWTLPVSGLRYWALGLPAPSGPRTADASVQLDALGRAATILQSGWRVTYSEYQSDSFAALPRKLEVTNFDDVDLRLVIDRWETGPARP